LQGTNYLTISFLYVKLQDTLNSIIRKEEDFAEFNITLIDTTKAGLIKFDEYFQYMKENNTYWIACILDPYIKTNWLWGNISDANKIIT
jgi:hypothetical protein